MNRFFSLRPRDNHKQIAKLQKLIVELTGGSKFDEEKLVLVERDDEKDHHLKDLLTVHDVTIYRCPCLCTYRVDYDNDTIGYVVWNSHIADKAVLITEDSMPPK